MKIKFKKLHENAVLPSYAKAGDAGLDITAINDGEMQVSDDGKDVWYYIEYKTGLSVEIPENHVGFLFPRSSISKSALSLSNSVGVIDSGYRGEIGFRFKIDSGVVNEAVENSTKPAVYRKGDRIGQLMILPYPVIEPEFGEELTTTERGDGGFGSTNKETV